MDWKAIEANEKELQAGIADAIADGSKDALSWVVAAELQLAIMRPFLVWMAKHRDKGRQTTNAIVLNAASLLAETAENTVWTSKAGVERDKEDTLMVLIRQTGEHALRLLRGATDHEAGEDTGVKFGTNIDLGGRPDA